MSVCLCVSVCACMRVCVCSAVPRKALKGLCISPNTTCIDPEYMKRPQTHTDSNTQTQTDTLSHSHTHTHTMVYTGLHEISISYFICLPHTTIETHKLS